MTNRRERVRGSNRRTLGAGRRRGLRLIADHYRTLVERLPVAAYLEPHDESAATTYISPAIEALLGYPQEEWTSDPDFWRKVLHPDDLERILAEHYRSGTTGGRLRAEYRLLTRDGRTVWVRDEAVTVRDPITGE